jgi:hypothetical protein
MIIDADGLFNGGRWRKCSNAARLHAPYLLLASNGYGRLELDPARIVGRAFLTFSPRPSEDVILGFVREYVGHPGSATGEIPHHGRQAQSNATERAIRQMEV